ncbi:Glutamyl-tRNA(Gln) amidotransferase subunit A [Gammaproteobacteria bacterium]
MHDSTLLSASLSELSAGLDAGEFSSRELTQATLERIAALNEKLNAFITVTTDLALAQADAADARRAAGETAPLLGIPIAHKDIFCTQGVKTSCGSRMLDSFIAPYDATVVTRLQQAGAVMTGKTNMDEFAMGSSTETSFYGPVHNPWDLDAVPGGSSGGSAAAVAARLVTAATGTDTGGSIRQPAALCGITGIKPSYGLVSRYGMIAFASSLDQGGPLAQSAMDCAILLGAMAGFDPLDSTSLDQPVPNYMENLDSPLTGVRLGLPREYFGEGLDHRVDMVIQEAVQALERLGAVVKDISLPNAHLAVPTYYVLAPAEASSNLARYDGVRYGHRCAEPRNLLDLYTRSRSEGFGAEVKRRIMIGTYTLSAGYYDAYYLKAQKLRRLISDDFHQAFTAVDVILGPVSPTVAFNIGEKTSDPVTMYLSDIYTIAVNLAGLPGISIPVGFVNGRPVGMQLIGDYWREGQLLNIAHRYQQETDWHRRVPRE